MEHKEIRADYDDRHITVYQAYNAAIADAAVAAGTFVPPFRAGRMTWIKPSFRWMVYRCGWASKPDQERVLAVRMTREGFDRAVREAVPSSEGVGRKPEVRVQWDPERDLHHRPLDHRSIQLGLAGTASERYVREWIVGITDITPLVREIHGHVRAGDLDAATALLPPERPYFL
ncbi:hypothetical protein FHS29_002919 [Saccharothrix tamanrassetensis]|uniref:DUF4291 domain-containing protein n=1 Tax=Saccharothrix tamanrassetensis TaxID=1051531 RepID=A0A841CH66_9PSEU|nr:DUF4291 domain-containing protein [Saccharothrix tamanrassetensis]MBB5956333.1 hypothetical protein [Saccharothrix tamanrassetensis]